MPTWVTKETSLGTFVAAPDGTAKGLPYQQWCYLVRTKPPRAAIEGLVQYIRSAPCIASVTLSSKIDEQAYYVSMTVTSVGGDRMRLIYSPIAGLKRSTNAVVGGSGNGTSRPLTGQAPTTMAASGDDGGSHEWASVIERLLGANKAIWFYGTGGPSLSLGAGTVASRLPLATEAILSSRPKAQKIEILRKLGFFPRTDKFIDGFLASEQLAVRLKGLAKEYSVEPMTMEQLEESGLDEANGVPAKPLNHPSSRPQEMSSGSLKERGGGKWVNGDDNHFFGQLRP
jgi:hypothetical protein